MSVAIIGAGVSGLCTAKALRDRGIEHTVFEASDDVGGNWYFGNPNGRSAAYRSLHIDTSNDRISFADYPMPDSYPDFPHHTEIHQWLRSFADEFGLRERIRFGTEVKRAERLEGGGWDVDGERHESLVVCNGHHWDPRFPDFPGTFDGPTLHSHHYIDTRDPVDMHDKRVLVVGIGNSAVDICSEVSRKGVASATFLSTRSGAWVLPKYIFGRPADTLVKTNPRLPLAFQRRMGALLQRVVSGKPEHFGLPKPNHRFLEAHPTVSSELLLRLRVPARAGGDGRAGRALGRRAGQAGRRRAAGRPRALRRRQRRGDRRHRLRDRLPDLVPVLPPGVHQRAGQRAAALQADVQARGARSRVRRARAGDPDDLPVRRAAGEARRAV